MATIEEQIQKAEQKIDEVEQQISAVQQKLNGDDNTLYTYFQEEHNKLRDEEKKLRDEKTKLLDLLLQRQDQQVSLYATERKSEQVRAASSVGLLFLPLCCFSHFERYFITNGLTKKGPGHAAAGHYRAAGIQHGVGRQLLQAVDPVSRGEGFEFLR